MPRPRHLYICMLLGTLLLNAGVLYGDLSWRVHGTLNALRDADPRVQALAITEFVALRHQTAFTEEEQRAILKQSSIITTHLKRGHPAAIPLLQPYRDRLPPALQSLLPEKTTNDSPIDNLLKADPPHRIRTSDGKLYRRLRAINTNRPGSTMDVLHLLDLTHPYRELSPRFRFLAYYLSGENAGAQLLIHRLGQSNNSFDTKSRREAGLEIIDVFIPALDAINESTQTASFSGLRLEIAEQLAAVAVNGSWTTEKRDKLARARIYKALTQHPETDLYARLVRFALQENHAP